MKRNRFTIPVIGAAYCALLCTGAFAAGRQSVTATYGGVSIYLNNVKQTATDVNGKTVEPLSYNGTTYVPIRAVSQWLGKTVTWDGQTHSVYIASSPYSDSDIASAKKVIEDYFTLFASKDYTEMKKLCTGDAADADYAKSGVFGMEQATLTSCSYNAGDTLRDGKSMVFDCSFKMKPMANSVYDPKDTTASFLILVKKTDRGFLISSFATGI